LDFSETFADDFTHLQTDELAESFLLGSESFIDLADDFSSLGAGVAEPLLIG
jgi:hypothetical protein